MRWRCYFALFTESREAWKAESGASQTGPEAELLNDAPMFEGVVRAGGGLYGSG